jgi:hypothetical protein
MYDVLTKLLNLFKKKNWRLGASGLGGRDQEDHGSKPTQAK